jgi:hypothetical protein
MAMRVDPHGRDDALRVRAGPRCDRAGPACYRIDEGLRGDRRATCSSHSGADAAPGGPR